MVGVRFEFSGDPRHEEEEGNEVKVDEGGGEEASGNGGADGVQGSGSGGEQDNFHPSTLPPFHPSTLLRNGPAALHLHQHQLDCLNFKSFILSVFAVNLFSLSRLA